MKKSQYLEKYGMVIDYPEKAVNMIGKEQILVTETSETKYLCEDIRFSDTQFIIEGKRYLGIQFLFNDFTNEPFWTDPFQTEILEPEESEGSKEDRKKMADKIAQALKTYHEHYNGKQ